MHVLSSASAQALYCCIMGAWPTGSHPTARATAFHVPWDLPAGSATAAGGKSRDAVLSELAADIDERLAGVFDIEAVRYKYPVDYNESMNTGEQG